LLVLLIERLAEDDAVADAFEPLDELGLIPVDEVLVLPAKEGVLDAAVLDAVELAPLALTPDCAPPLVVEVSPPLPPDVVPALVPHAAASNSAPPDAHAYRVADISDRSLSLAHRSGDRARYRRHAPESPRTPASRRGLQTRRKMKAIAYRRERDVDARGVPGRRHKRVSCSEET
jgi:hypothetical protein